jgi:hypothetical protein
MAYQPIHWPARFQYALRTGNVPTLHTPEEDRMKRLIDRLPELVIALAAGGLWLHGPIPQLPHYHDFADQRVLVGVTHGADVLSNIGFAVVGSWGLWRLWPARRRPQLAKGGRATGCS